MSIDASHTKTARVLSKHPLSEKSIIGRPLTERETSVLSCVAEGLSNKGIAACLNISEHTVKFHLGNAAKKMGAASRTKAAVTFTLQQGNRARAPEDPVMTTGYVAIRPIDLGYPEIDTRLRLEYPSEDLKPDEMPGALTVLALERTLPERVLAPDARRVESLARICFTREDLVWLGARIPELLKEMPS